MTSVKNIVVLCYLEDMNMQLKDDIRKYGSLLVERGLTWGHSGNISVRSEDSFLISAGGADLRDLSDDDIVVCRIDNEQYDGAKSPSMETGLHREIYRICGNASAVIHSQPFYSTLVACSDMDIRTDFLPEAMAYLGGVQRIPYYHAGSKKLAEAASLKAVDSRVLILNNHGAVCWGTSLEEAFLLTQALEFCCRLLITSKINGIEFNYLGEEVMSDFLEHLRSIGR